MKNHVIPLAVTLALLAGIQLACAQPTLITIYSFTNGNDGAYPLAGLIQASDGNLYGTAGGGGAFEIGNNSVSTIFRITTGGVLTPLYSFTNGNDGSNVVAGLVQASDGNLYGTAQLGGTNGDGTIFRITTNGVFTPLYSFTGGNDGQYLSAGLMQASDGNLYGTAVLGGTNGNGTIFRITTNGVFTPLYNFTAYSGPNSTNGDGANPYDGLVQASDGNLYGTAAYGGANGNGTIFCITTNGVFTPLYNFTASSGPYSTNGDGANTLAGLMQASDGNLYGVAGGGGTNGAGTIFRITTNGVFTLLYSFSFGNAYGNDGEYPQTDLVQASDGNFYGTASAGGTIGLGQYGSGTIFRITTNGVLTLLYSFTAYNDGGFPAGLVQASDGNLYGTTFAGGAYNSGTVFEFAIAPPFLSISPSGNLSVLFWPAWATNCVVQSTTNLASPNWVTLSNAVVTIAATNTVTVTNSLSAQFFRLASP